MRGKKSERREEILTHKINLLHYGKKTWKYTLEKERWRRGKKRRRWRRFEAKCDYTNNSWKMESVCLLFPYSQLIIYSTCYRFQFCYYVYFVCAQSSLSSSFCCCLFHESEVLLAVARFCLFSTNIIYTSYSRIASHNHVATKLSCSKTIHKHERKVFQEKQREFH